MTTAIKGRRARKRFRTEADRQKIYCIPGDRRRTFARLREQLYNGLMGQMDIPAILAIETWSAASTYMEASRDSEALVVVDLQEVNRKSNLFKSRWLGPIPFECYLDIVAIGTEVLLSKGDLASAQRLMEHFHLQRSIYCKFYIASFQLNRPKFNYDIARTIPAFESEIVLPFLVGHELGHHWVSIYKEDVSMSRALGMEISADAMDYELLFAQQKIAHMRRYRAGQPDLMSGLLERAIRADAKQSDDYEPFSDICGLALMLQDAYEYDELLRRIDFIPSMVEASEILYYLNFFAQSFYPAGSSLLRIRSADMRRRFSSATSFFADFLQDSLFVRDLGWTDDKRRSVADSFQTALPSFAVLFERAEGVIWNTTIGVLFDCFSHGLPHPTFDEYDLSTALDLSDVGLLFEPHHRYQNWMIGYAFGLRALFHAIEPRFHMGESEPPSKSFAVLATESIGFRHSWRQYLAAEFRALAHSSERPLRAR